MCIGFKVISSENSLSFLKTKIPKAYLSQNPERLTEVVVAIDRAVNSHLVEDRHHLFSLSEGAH